MSMIGYYFPADDDMVQRLKEGGSGELIFSEELFFQYVWEYFDALKQFFKKTAEKGLHMLTFLG